MITNRIPSFVGRMPHFDTKWSSLPNGTFSFGEISFATDDKKHSERMNRDVFWHFSGFFASSWGV